jgi:hypothetical protein
MSEFWVVLVVAVGWPIVLVGAFSRMYASRFKNMTAIFVEAMAERDAAFQKFRAQMARDYIMDASTFDQSLEDVSDFMPPIAEIEGIEDDERETGD